MRQMLTMVLGLVLPAVASASELDEVKGWRATKTVVVAAAPDFVTPHVADFEKWAEWSAWGAGAKLGCEGTPGVDCTGRKFA